MSQLTERYMQRFIKGFNTAFNGSKQGFAEELIVKRQGMSMGGGSGLAITIGERRAEFNEYGELVSGHQFLADKEIPIPTTTAINGTKVYGKVKRFLRQHEGRLQHSDNQREWVEVPNQ